MTPADYVKLGWKLIPLHHGRPDGGCTCGHLQGPDKLCECEDPKCKVKHKAGSTAKHPRQRDWPESASADLDVIAEWHRRWPGCNLGIATGAASGVVVVDVDPKNGGDVSVKRFMADFGRFPSTPVQRTPSGGYHFLFRAPAHPVSNSPLGREYPGIDIRADGGQIVAAPSKTPTGAYSWAVSPLSVALADLPASVLAFLQRGTVRPTSAVTPGSDSRRGYFPPAPAAVLEAARAALERHGPAVDGQAGGLHTVHAGMLLTHDYALTDAEALPLLLEWNETCVPPWEPDELAAKSLGNGRRYGKNPYGSARTMDALETLRKLIMDWQTNPGADPQTSMFPQLINPCRDLRFDDPAKRELAEKELKAATGIGARALALPPVVNVAAKAEQSQRREAHRQSPRSGTVDTAEPLDTARRFLTAGRDAEGCPELVRWQGEFWRALGTHYIARSDENVSGDLYRFLEGKQEVATGAPVKPDRTMVEVLAHALKAAAAIEADAPPSWVSSELGEPPAEEFVSFRNGLLHVPTRGFRPPSRRLFTLNAVGFDFAPLAPRPAQWLRFLDQLWGDDAESLETLQEVFGLLLTGDTSFQKIFMLVGPRRSGKGTIGRLLQALVGKENYCAPTLNGMGKEFGLESLVGKTLAVISDARLSGRADQSVVVENLLRISGEDVISAPRKYKTDWSSKLRVRFVILSNEVPALMDQSGALASRFVVLQLRRSFYGEEDRALEAKLLTELPGILLWALEGLDRLRARGYFRQPGSGAEAVRQLEALASPIKAFLEDKCELALGATVDSATLYGAWSSWCMEQGRPPGTVPIFGRNLLSACPELKVSRPRADGGRARVYEGIRVLSAG